MTDVQIATQLLADAFQDAFDTALLISGDSDLVPPVAMLRRLFPTKRVVVCCPPARRSIDLQPDPVVKPDGTRLNCPKEWSG